MRRRRCSSLEWKPVIDINDPVWFHAVVSKTLISVRRALRPKGSILGLGQFAPHIPPELRAEIYRHVFSSANHETNLMLQTSAKKPHVWFWATHSETAILRVSKQIYDEALPVLYKTATFVWPLLIAPKIITTVLEPMRPHLRNSIHHIDLMLIIIHDMHGWNAKIEQLKSTFALLVKCLPGLKRANVQIHFIGADRQFLATPAEISAAVTFIVDVISPLRPVQRLCVMDPALETDTEWNDFAIPGRKRRTDVLDEVRRIMSNHESE